MELSFPPSLVRWLDQRAEWAGTSRTAVLMAGLEAVDCLSDAELRGCIRNAAHRWGVELSMVDADGEMRRVRPKEREPVPLDQLPHALRR